MIKPNELRINNYYFGDVEITGSLAAKVGLSDSNKVLQLTEEHFKTLVLAGYLNFLSPIPLTPEWLERLGFEKNNDISEGAYEFPRSAMVGLYYLQGTKTLIEEKDVYVLALPSANGMYYTPTRPKHGCFYVHQLQSLYTTLTGLELNISNPAYKDLGMLQ